MRVMISQPRYLPCLEYLRRIHNVDLFIILNHVQRTERGFENRNKLIVNGKPKWLTIPVVGSARDLIMNSEIVYESDVEWFEKHIRIVIENYKFHKCFNANDLDKLLELACLDYQDVLIDHLHRTFGHFKMKVDCKYSSSFKMLRLKGTPMLKELCRLAGATTYVTGATAKEYGLTENSFESIGCKVEFDNNKPIVYKQKGTSEFQPYMGFIDALFNIGQTETEKLIKTYLNGNIRI